MALYLVHLVQCGKSQNVITNFFYAISHFHDVFGVTNPCKSAFLKHILEGSCRSAPSGTSRSRAPIKSSDLKLLVDKFGGPQASLLDLRDVTMCLLAFSSFLRFDEVISLKWSHIEFHDCFFSLFIPRSKTDQRAQGKTVVVAKSDKCTCPYGMLSRFKSLSNADQDDFIFTKMQFFKSKGLYQRRAGQPISQTRCRESILAKLKVVGVDTSSINLHSFRIGGASAACNNNVSDKLIQKHGRWASEKSKDLYCRFNLKNQLQVTLNIDL